MWPSRVGRVEACQVRLRRGRQVGLRYVESSRLKFCLVRSSRVWSRQVSHVQPCPVPSHLVEADHVKAAMSSQKCRVRPSLFELSHVQSWQADHVKTSQVELVGSCPGRRVESRVSCYVVLSPVLSHRFLSGQASQVASKRIASSRVKSGTY
jgi:hypothetical protein